MAIANSTEAANCNKSSSIGKWVILTHPIRHLTPNGEFFSSYKSAHFGVLKMANGSVSKIVGMGEVWAKASKGKEMDLQNVYHVPDLLDSYLSFHVLAKEGFEYRVKPKRRTD